MSTDTQPNGRNPGEATGGEELTNLTTHTEFTVKPDRGRRRNYKHKTTKSGPGPEGQYVTIDTEHVNLDEAGNRMHPDRILAISRENHVIHKPSDDGKQPGDIHGVCNSPFHGLHHNQSRLVKHGYDGICDGEGNAICNQCRQNQNLALIILALLVGCVIIGLFWGLMD